MLDRLTLTQRLLSEFDKDLDGSTALQEWWWDPRPGGGLRLTDNGFQILTAIMKLQHWHFHIQDIVLKPRNLLALDRLMTCPYYLKKHRRQHNLILFGDRESMMASLYGDIEKFIASL